jgi:isoaspartyl peptidase/L-asparaginase-like protein (Ntn-hydrolase superfamily)
MTTASTDPTSTEHLNHRDQRLLNQASVLFAIGLVIHTADHLRRGASSVSAELWGAGTVAAVVAVAALVVVHTGRPGAPLVAVAAGFPLAVGYMSAHLLPEWSVLSDPYPGNDVDQLSWIATLTEITGALAFGTAGAVVLHRRGGLASASSAA